MPDFDVNAAERAKCKTNSTKINKNLNDLKLELVHLGLCSGKVWENRFFSILHELS